MWLFPSCWGEGRAQQTYQLWLLLVSPGNLKMMLSIFLYRHFFSWVLDKYTKEVAQGNWVALCVMCEVGKFLVHRVYGIYTDVIQSFALCGFLLNRNCR